MTSESVRAAVTVAAAKLKELEKFGIDPTELTESLAGWIVNLGLFTATNGQDSKALAHVIEAATPADIGKMLDAAHGEAREALAAKTNAIHAAWKLIEKLLFAACLKSIGG